jgi:hypothetical protein
MNYETMIYDFLLGNTPKEKYEYLQKIYKEGVQSKGENEAMKNIFRGFEKTPNNAPIGDLKIFFEHLIQDK